MFQILCLRKNTCSKPRQNYFGNLIEHGLHCSYLSHQWCHSRHHWEILDEEGTLLKSIFKKWHFTRAAVPFEIPILEKADGNRRRFLEWQNLSFHWSAENTSCNDQSCYITLICWSLPYCLNDVDFIRAVTLNSCKTVLRHTAEKWRNSFYDRTLQTS